MSRRVLLVVVGIGLLALVGLGVLLSLNNASAPALAASPSFAPSPEATSLSPTAATIPLQVMPGNTFIALTWSAVEGAAGYHVYRDGSERPLNPNPLQETSFEDLGLTNGRIYQYRVVAVGTDGAPLAESGVIEAIPASRP